MIYAGPVPEEAIDRVRASFDAQALSRVSISQLERVVVCRYLGGRMSEAKKLFRQVWEILREAGLNKAAAAPRIWAT